MMGALVDHQRYTDAAHQSVERRQCGVARDLPSRFVELELSFSPLHQHVSELLWIDGIEKQAELLQRRDVLIELGQRVVVGQLAISFTMRAD